jgi:excisionase family DNA binding protein
MTPEPWMNLREASEYAAVSRWSLQRAVRSGRLACAHHGLHPLFRATTIDAWLKREEATWWHRSKATPRTCPDRTQTSCASQPETEHRSENGGSDAPVVG